MAADWTVGDEAPEFSLQDQTGKRVSLKSFRGQVLVLYFYPKDHTPGCTKEACDFRDSSQRIQRTGAAVLGISLDGPESHRRFIDKLGLPFSLLCDEDAAVSKAYGAYKQKEMYGKKFWGIERSTFVIDKAGRIKAIFRKVKVDGHVEAVLATLQST